MEQKHILAMCNFEWVKLQILTYATYHLSQVLITGIVNFMIKCSVYKILLPYI